MTLGADSLTSTPIGGAGADSAGANYSVRGYVDGIYSTTVYTPTALVEPPDAVFATTLGIPPSAQSPVHIGKNYLIGLVTGVCSTGLSAPSATYNQSFRLQGLRGTVLPIPSRLPNQFTPSVGLVSKVGVPSATTNGVTSFPLAIGDIIKVGSPVATAKIVGVAASYGASNTGKPNATYTQFGLVSAIAGGYVGSPKRFVDLADCVFITTPRACVEVFTDV